MSYNRIACAILALAALGSASAEELTRDFVLAHRDAVVAKVQYLGNARTKDRAMAELTGLAAGQRLSEVDPDAVSQRILKSGLFSEVELDCEMDADAALVSVSVKEKWTLIPVPGVSFGTEDWSVGISVLERNFLGMRDTLALSASLSNLGPTGLVAFIDPMIGGAPVSLRAFASMDRSEVAPEHMDGTAFASYVETAAAGGLSVEYPSESALKGEANLTVRYSGVGSGEAAAYSLYEDSLDVEAGGSMTFDGQRRTDYFDSGPYLKGYYLHGFSIEGPPSFDVIGASATWQAGIPLGGFICLGAVGEYSGKALQDRGSLSGAGYRTISQSASFAKAAAAGYASMEFPIVRLSWSVMTLGAFYEAGAYTTGLEGLERSRVFHGPGASYRLYLKDVAIPAVGIDAAFNVPERKFRGGLYLGLSLN
jgi:hypothetical protein